MLQELLVNAKILFLLEKLKQVFKITTHLISAGLKEIAKLFLAAPLMYFIGPHWTLVDSASADHIVIFEGFGSTIEVSGYLYYVLYTYFCYITPFFIGLHFTYLDFYPFLGTIVLNK
jgi:hypothetical protein